ncbi:MAG: hypothetical protein ACI9OJ_003377 [Myxococcota bacterium]|jgi:hypothetical protein
MKRQEPLNRTGPSHNEGRWSHRIAVVLLIVGAGVWGSTWSTTTLSNGEWQARYVANPPADVGAPVQWGPQLVTAAEQIKIASLQAARLIVVGGSGVLGVAMISALLLFAASRTARLPSLRVHRAVGASLRRLRNEATLEACTAVGVAVSGAAILGLLIARLSALTWASGSGTTSGGLPFLQAFLAVLLMTPVVGLLVVSLFRQRVPANPLPPARASRHVPDPFSGFAVTQVAVSVAALVVVALIPAQSSVADSSPDGTWLEVRSAATVDTQRLVASLEGVEGVTRASVASPGAWAGMGTQDFLLSECGRCSIGGLPTPLKGAVAAHVWSGSGGLSQLDVRLEEGRDFTPEELASGSRVVLVSRSYANTNFERGQAVGRRVRVGQDPDAWHEVVGVVDGGPAPVALGAVGQVDAWVFLPLSAGVLRTVAVRIEGTFAADRVTAAALGAVPDATVAAEAYARFIAVQAAPTTWLRGWLLLIGATALLISLVGVFTATSEQIRQRLGELAVRRAVGASRRDISRRVLGQSTRIAALGGPIGLWVATFGLQTLRQTSGVELPSGTVAACLLGAVWATCIAGGLVPAHRAGMMAPAEAIRAAE